MLLNNKLTIPYEFWQPTPNWNHKVIRNTGGPYPPSYFSSIYFEIKVLNENLKKFENLLRKWNMLNYYFYFDHRMLNWNILITEIYLSIKKYKFLFETVVFIVVFKYNYIYIIHWCEIAFITGLRFFFIKNTSTYSTIQWSLTNKWI